MQIRIPPRTRWPIAAMAMAMALLAMPGSAQDAGVYRNTLTNRDVITLADAGFSEEFLVEMVTTSRTRFDTTAEGLADLAKHGVKEDLIRAMRGVHSEAPASAPAAPASGPEKPVRVFVQAGASAAGLSRPDRQTAEIVRTFGQTCSNVVVTSRREAAAFTVVLEYKSGNLLHRGGSRMVVFDRAGDMVYGASERALGKALRGFCMAGQGFLGSAAGGGAGGVPDALPGAR